MTWQLHPVDAFGQFAEEWDRLAEACGGVPFLTARFVQPLLAHFATGSECVARWVERSDTQAMTIVVRKSAFVWETFQPSQLPLGPLVMAPGHDLVTLARALLRRLPGYPLRLGVTQLDPDMYVRPAESAHATTLDYVDTAAVPISGGFEEYWSARGKNLRANLRKQRNRLAAEGREIEVEVLGDAEAMPEAIASYGRLESAGWKAAGGTAIDAGNRQGRFYLAMLENFARAGLARVYRCRIAGSVAAVDLCIEGGGMQVVLKTTYDEAMKAFSPASLLREEEFKAHFAEGRIRRVEFYGKVMDWHTHWTRDARGLYHLNVSRFGWLSRLLAARARKESQPAAAPADA